MITRYCHRCGANLGLFGDVYTNDVLGTPYQLSKFMKHTVPNAFWNAVSVFETASTGRYADYVVNAVASGAVEIDHMGRRNFIWLAGELTGFRYEQGVAQAPQDGVKVVLSSETGKIHTFPVSGSGLVTQPCARCGGLVST